MKLLPERAKSLEDRRRQFERQIDEIRQARRPQFYTPVHKQIIPHINVNGMFSFMMEWDAANYDEVFNIHLHE